MCFVFLRMKMLLYVFCFMQKTAYELRISDWSSDVCSSDLTLCEGSNYGGLDHSRYSGDDGKLAIVTGATGGLGLETALGLAGAGAEVVLAGRNPRSEERRAGKEGGSTCRSRGQPAH